VVVESFSYSAVTFTVTSSSGVERPTVPFASVVYSLAPAYDSFAGSTTLTLTVAFSTAVPFSVTVTVGSPSASSTVTPRSPSAAATPVIAPSDDRRDQQQANRVFAHVHPGRDTVTL